MGVDDELCQTRLGLGFGSVRKSAKKSSSSSPSLTLSLFGEYQSNRKVDVCSNDSAAASSLSNASVKREREEEVDEAERVSWRGSDEDDDGSNGRKKLRLTKPQSALLEESFKRHSTLNPVSLSLSNSLSRSLSPDLSLILGLGSVFAETEARIGEGLEA